MQRRHPVFERMVRDSRRNTWIGIVPARDFIRADYPVDGPPPSGYALGLVTPAEPPRVEQPLGPAERAIPYIMLVWACVVWSFLFFDLGHL